MYFLSQAPSTLFQQIRKKENEDQNVSWSWSIATPSQRRPHLDARSQITMGTPAGQVDKVFASGNSRSLEVSAQEVI